MCGAGFSKVKTTLYGRVEKGVRDIKVDGREAPIRAATVRSREEIEILKAVD